MRNKWVLPVFVLFLVCCPGFLLAQENLTITTYYPSPNGSYRNIDVSNSVNIGPFQSVDTNAVGAIGLTGVSAGYSFSDRNLAASPGALGTWPAGDRFTLYAQAGEARIRTDTTGDIITFENDGDLNIRGDFHAKYIYMGP